MRSFSRTGLFENTTERWVLVQRAHVYFETEQLVAMIRMRHAPVAEYRIKDVQVLEADRISQNQLQVALRSHLQAIEGGIVQKPYDESQRFGSSQRRTGYAEWIALGAVAAGSVGAIMGMANCRRSASRNSAMSASELDPETVTAPHGDKLKGAVV